MKKILCAALAALLLLCAVPFAASAEEVEYVVYENDFSDPSTLSQFNQYRIGWEIRDGALWVTGGDDDHPDSGSTFGHIILNQPEKWKNYIVEVDVKNVQTSTGVIARSDVSRATDETDNSFCGYLGFLSNDATKGAMGKTAEDGTSYGNNYGGSVISAGTTVGSDIHFVITVDGDDFTCEIYDLDTSVLLYSYTVTDTVWTEGTVGLRCRLSNAAVAGDSVGNVSFDNLKVTLIGEEAKAKLAASTSSVVTEAPATEAPATDAPATDAPATDAPVTPEGTPETGDSLLFVAGTALIAGLAVALIAKRKVRN